MNFIKCIQYINYLDIQTFTKLDTAFCNKKLRPYFLEICQLYLTNEIFTIIEFHKYVYLRKIQIHNLVIFNNEQCKLFIDNIDFISPQLKYLSISDCCIDNLCIQNILVKLKHLQILRIGIEKFHNPYLDIENADNYKLKNIYSNTYLDEKYEFMLVNIDYEYNIHSPIIKMPIFKKAKYAIRVPFDCAHHINKHRQIQLISDTEYNPIKYVPEIGIECQINIMNNIVGDLYTTFDILSLKELYIHNTHNLKYSNIILLLARANISILSLNIDTDEKFDSLLKFNIKYIEIINSKLTLIEILKYIQLQKNKISKIKIYYLDCSESKLNISIYLNTDNKIEFIIYKKMTKIQFQKIFLLFPNIKISIKYINDYL